MINFNLKIRELILLAIIIGALVSGLVFTFVSNSHNNDALSDEKQQDAIEDAEPREELMDLVVYLQDKEEVLYNDCGITYQRTIQVPKTRAVADASLKYLFADELASYGRYESVAIKDGVAQIIISNPNDPESLKLSGLSSCESRHLFAVLEDTLTQYETIESVELFSPAGKIQF